MNKKTKVLAITTILYSAIALSPLAQDSVYAAKKNTNQGHCFVNQEFVVKDENGENGVFVISAPEGYRFVEIAVKAGSDQSTDDACNMYTVDTNDGCYNVIGVGTDEVTAVKVGEGSDCKDISHIEGKYAVVDDDQDDQDDEEEDNDDQEDEGGTGGENDQDESSDEDDSSNESDSNDEVEEEVLGVDDEDEKQGEVLGAETLADTGIMDTILLDLIVIAGLALMTVASAKEERK